MNESPSSSLAPRDYEATRRRIVEADREYVWRPYTSSERHTSFEPLVIKEAVGSWLVDVDGRRFIDGNASWWTNNLGHGHPRIRKALVHQSTSLLHCALADITHEHAALLAEELIAVAPRTQSGPQLKRVFYSDDGSTAVEVAIKIAFQYWHQNGEAQRTRFICLGSGFHGETLGAMSVSGMKEFHGAFGSLLFDRIQTPIAHSRHEWEQAVAYLEDKLATCGPSTAAVIVEPLVQGAAGMRFCADDLLRRIANATRAAGTLLIADEVFTGLGRTGTMWACDQAQIVPDLLCSAKSLSAGALPFAATMATEEIFDGFRGGKERALMHGHTFCGNPLGASIAREVLNIYRDEKIIEEIGERTRMMQAAFDQIGTLPGARDARVLGMIAAVDLGDRGYLGTKGWRIYERARELGAYIRPLGNTVYLTPSLNIPLSDLERLLEITVQCISEELNA